MGEAHPGVPESGAKGWLAVAQGGTARGTTMRRILTATLLPLLAGAIVLSIVAAVLLRAWNVAPQFEGGTRGRATDTPGLTGHDLITGYKLATMFAVDDRGLVEDVPTPEAPDISVAVTPAVEGGWNVDVDLRNFALALPIEYQAHVPGRGHLHLWVDGDYVDDFVASRHWVPPLPPGVHEIVVSAATVDHRVYARAGRPLVFRTYVRSADARAAGPLRPIQIPSAGDATVQVERGTLVRLDFPTGPERQVALDGYGFSAPIGPRSGAAFLFLADQPGTFVLREDGRPIGEIVIAP